MFSNRINIYLKQFVACAINSTFRSRLVTYELSLKQFIDIGLSYDCEYVVCDIKQIFIFKILLLFWIK